MKPDRINAVVEMEEPQRPAPLYAVIGDVLGKAITEGRIEPGVVLLEGPVAELLNSTRTPVRQALRTLEEQGLVSRFDGRGYLAGPAGTEPRRVELDVQMLGIESAQPVRKILGWEAIYNEIERDVVHLSVFDYYRINELELARHFGVGRMVARDVLLRLENLGLVGKDERLRWVVTPLDSRRITHLYELRCLLEPAALGAAMAAGGVSEVQGMMRNLRGAMHAYPSIGRAELDKLEHDLHVEFLSHCPNPELLQSLQRTRCILTLSKHVLGDSAPMPKRDPFMSEHLAVLNAVVDGDRHQAQELLRTHLEESCKKVVRRAAQVRERCAVPRFPYASA